MFFFEDFKACFLVIPLLLATALLFVCFALFFTAFFACLLTLTSDIAGFLTGTEAATKAVLVTTAAFVTTGATTGVVARSAFLAFLTALTLLTFPDLLDYGR